MALKFSIEQSDVHHALQKWDGRETVVENGRCFERQWKASDREFYETIGGGRIDATILKRFAARNSNEDRTGGYSVIRKFWGGADSWAPRLQEFLQVQIIPAREQFAEVRDPAIGHELVIKLGRMIGTSPGGSKQPLGPVAASKLIFFACPEMPIHIYDSVVATVFAMKSMEVWRFPEWCRLCQSEMPKFAVTEQLLPADRRAEFDNKIDWFTRRCQDLMYYRIGKGV